MNNGSSAPISSHGQVSAMSFAPISSSHHVSRPAFIATSSGFRLTTMTVFTVGQLAEEFKYTVLAGADRLGNRIEHTVVAAMEPQNVVPYIRPQTLVIAPGDRVDNILLSIIVLSTQYNDTGGLILTGGIELPPSIAPLLQKSRKPSDAEIDEAMRGIACRCATYVRIRGAIKDMIQSENPTEPLSDAHIARLLARQGLRVARRTVTKYRQMMRVPAYEMRRRQA